MLNFIDVATPPAPEEGENKEDSPEVEDSSEDLTLSAKVAEADTKAEETEDVPVADSDVGDSDEELRDKIVTALRDPNIEVMVVDGTALLEGEVPDDHAKVRAEAVAKLYAQKAVSYTHLDVYKRQVQCRLQP